MVSSSLSRFSRSEARLRNVHYADLGLFHTVLKIDMYISTGIFNLSSVSAAEKPFEEIIR